MKNSNLSIYKIIGEIPARIGSQRVKRKNLRLINGKPLICYAIEAARNAVTLTDVYVNSENDEIGQVGIDNGVKYYKRAASLSTEFSTSDEFNYDFIKNTNPDVLVMINPVSPLIDSSDIDKVVTYYLENDLDTVITIREEYLQSLCNNQPINFNMNGMLPRTQDILPIQICTWCVCVWKASVFVKSFEKNGYAVFAGKVGFYPLSFRKSIKISTEDDFILAEMLLKNKIFTS